MSFSRGDLVAAMQQYGYGEGLQQRILSDVDNCPHFVSVMTGARNTEGKPLFEAIDVCCFLQAYPAPDDKDVSKLRAVLDNQEAVMNISKCSNKAWGLVNAVKQPSDSILKQNPEVFKMNAEDEYRAYQHKTSVAYRNFQLWKEQEKEDLKPDAPGFKVRDNVLKLMDKYPAMEQVLVGARTGDDSSLFKPEEIWSIFKHGGDKLSEDPKNVQDLLKNPDNLNVISHSKNRVQSFMKIWDVQYDTNFDKEKKQISESVASEKGLVDESLSHTSREKDSLAPQSHESKDVQNGKVSERILALRKRLKQGEKNRDVPTVKGIGRNDCGVILRKSGYGR